MTPPKYDKEKNTVTSDLQQESSDEVKTEQVTSDDDVEVDEVSDYNSAFGSFTSSTLSSMSAYTHSPSHSLVDVSRTIPPHPMISSSDGVEKDEIPDCDSSFGSFRSSTSTSVSEYRWRPFREIEEIDEGWTVFSRTSSSRTSVSSFCTTQQQTRRRNWRNWFFRPSDVKGKPTSIVDKSIETIMIGDWGLKKELEVATAFDQPKSSVTSVVVDKSIETIMIYWGAKPLWLMIDHYGASTAFDHRGYDGIKRIIIYCSSCTIYSMRIQYTKQGELEWSEEVGRRDDGDRRHEIVLDDPREYITKVKGYSFTLGQLASLTFFTNRETYGPFGSLEDFSRENLRPFEYSGGKLVGFKGSSDNYPFISSLGFYVQSPPPQSCEKCGGKYIISSATTSMSERVPNVNHQTTRETQQIISVRQFGISKSSFRPFDHGGGYDGIKRIFVSCHRKQINYLKVEYMKNGEPQLTDGIGKMNMKDCVTEVVLDYPNEFLQAVTGTTFGEIYGTYGVSCLTFHSNLKKYGPFGEIDVTTVGFPFEVSRGKIIGFQGEASEDALMAIGFHVVPTKYPISLLSDTCEASG